MLPQHFQQSQLHTQTQIHDIVNDFLPHQEGVIELDISEAACTERFTLEITRLHCRMPDGTRIYYERGGKGNAEIDARPFREELAGADGHLNVFLALPLLNPSEANVAETGHRTRYMTHEAPVTDLVTGRNTVTMPTRLLRPRIVFPSDNRANCDLLPLARISIRQTEFGSRPRLDPDFIPPAISIRATPRLHEIYKETGHRLKGKYESLRDLWPTRSGDIQYALKFQAVAVAQNTYKQFQSLDYKLHPFHLYLKMAEIIGQLSIFSDDDDLIRVDDYDHQELSKCFEHARNSLWSLLDRLEKTPHDRFVFERKDDDLKICALKPEWLTEKYRLYICFQSTKETGDVLRYVENRLKIGPLGMIKTLTQRRLPSMPLNNDRRHFAHLPPSPDNHYFEVTRHTDPDHPGASFQDLVMDPVLAVWGDTEFADTTALYVVYPDTK